MDDWHVVFPAPRRCRSLRFTVNIRVSWDTDRSEMHRMVKQAYSNECLCASFYFIFNFLVVQNASGVFFQPSSRWLCTSASSQKASLPYWSVMLLLCLYRDKNHWALNPDATQAEPSTSDRVEKPGVVLLTSPVYSVFVCLLPLRLLSQGVCGLLINQHICVDESSCVIEKHCRGRCSAVSSAVKEGQREERHY